MGLFSSSRELTAGRKYPVEVSVAPIGLPGKQQVCDLTGYYVAEPGDTVDSATAKVRANAINECRADRPGASDYRIISFRFDAA